MQRGYAILEQIENAPEVQQYIISEDDFELCRSHGLVEKYPDAAWDSYSISCHESVLSDLNIEPITDFPVIVLATVDLYIQ